MARGRQERACVLVVEEGEHVSGVTVVGHDSSLWGPYKKHPRAFAGSANALGDMSAVGTPPGVGLFSRWESPPGLFRGNFQACYMAQSDGEFIGCRGGYPDP